MPGMTCPFVALDGRPGMSEWHAWLDDNVDSSGRYTESGLLADRMYQTIALVVNK